MAMGTNKHLQTNHGYSALKISLFHDHEQITRLLRLERNWVVQEYKAWRHDKREEKLEKARRADELIQLQKQAAEEAERKRREAEAAKKKKKKKVEEEKVEKKSTELSWGAEYS